MDEQAAEAKFRFSKGADDGRPEGWGTFVWERAASRVRENLQDAPNAKHLSFLSAWDARHRRAKGNKGHPIDAPLAVEFWPRPLGSTIAAPECRRTGGSCEAPGLTRGEFKNNPERPMEVL